MYSFTPRLRAADGRLRQRAVRLLLAAALAATGLSVVLTQPASAVLCGAPGTTSVTAGSATASAGAGLGGVNVAVCEPSVGDVQVSTGGPNISGAKVTYGSCTSYYGPNCSSGNVVDVGINRDANGMVAVSHGGNANNTLVCNRPVIDMNYYGCTAGVGAGIATTGSASGPLGVSGTGPASGTVAISGTGHASGVVAATGTGSTNGTVGVEQGGVDAAYPVPIDGEAVVEMVANLAADSVGTYTDYKENLGDPGSYDPVRYAQNGGEGGASSGGPRKPDCLACRAHNKMYWSDHGWSEDVGVAFSMNKADERIDRQTFHAALLNARRDLPCYEGDYSWTASKPMIYNSQVPEALSTGKKGGANRRWTLASGHDWWDDGGHWEVKGGADICHKF